MRTKDSSIFYASPVIWGNVIDKNVMFTIYKYTNLRISVEI